MKFKVIKSSFDGISGGGSSYSKIEDVLMEVNYFKGWESLKELHNSIKKWAKSCRPGSVFTTQVTAIVAAACDRLDREENTCPYCSHEGLDYDEFYAVKDGDVEQEVSCPNCGERWIDVFALSKQRRLARREE